METIAFIRKAPGSAVKMCQLSRPPCFSGVHWGVGGELLRNNHKEERWTTPICNRAQKHFNIGASWPRSQVGEMRQLGGIMLFETFRRDHPVLVLLLAYISQLRRARDSPEIYSLVLSSSTLASIT